MSSGEKTGMSAKSNAAIITAATAIGSGLNFTATLVWTRLLDPREFGVYALVSASAVLLNAMIFEWLRIVGARTLFDPKAPTGISSQRANALFAIYSLTILLFLAVIAALYGLNVGFAEVAAQWWPLMAVFTLTEMALTIIQTIYRLQMRSWPYFWNSVARSLVSVLLGVALVWHFHFGALGTLLGMVVAQGVVAVVSMLVDPLWRTVKPWAASRTQITEVLHLGYPLIASCALTYAAGVTDRFLIGSTMGAHAVGLYAAPVDLLQKTLVFMMMTINLTGYPTLVRTYESKGPEAACKTLDDNLHLQLGLGLPTAVGLMVLAPGLVGLLLGPAFREEGARLLPLIGVASLLRCMVTFHLMMVFQVTRRMKWMIVPPIATLLVLIPAGLIGVRIAGLPGMAVAAVVAQAVCYALSAVLAKRVLPIRILSLDTYKIIAAATVMGLALYPFAHLTSPLATIALVAVGGGVYTIMLLALRVAPFLAAVRSVVGHRRFRRA